MLAANLINTPLPGRRTGIDVFGYPRSETDRLLKSISSALLPLLSGPQGDLLRQIQSALASSSGNVTQQLLLTKSLQSFPDFMQRPDAKIFLDLHEEKLREVIRWILEVRGSGGVRFYKKFRGFVPESVISAESRILLDYFLLNRELRAGLAYVIRRLDKAHLYAEPQPLAIRSETPNLREGYVPAEVAPPRIERPSVPSRIIGELVIVDEYNAASNNTAELVTRAETSLRQNSIFAVPPVRQVRRVLAGDSDEETVNARPQTASQ